jgi:hypothetical protein
VSGVIPDGLQKDSPAHPWKGGQETADLETLLADPRLEPVAGFEPGDLPFTRQREFVHLRAAPILPVSLSVQSATFPQVALSRIIERFNIPGGSVRLRRGSCGLQKDSHPTEGKRS